MKNEKHVELFLIFAMIICVLGLYFTINEYVNKVSNMPGPEELEEIKEMMKSEENVSRILLGSGKYIGNIYNVNYVDSTVTVDGSQEEWGDIESQNFYDMPEDMYDEDEMNPSFFKAAQTGTELCIFFHIYDNTDDGSSDKIELSGNFGDHVFRRNGLGDFPEYEVIDVVYVGWSGELCIPYSDVGTYAGNENCLDPISIRVKDNNEYSLKWPPFGEGAGQFCSPEGWGECANSEQCPSGEACYEGNCIEFSCHIPLVPGEHQCYLPEGSCYGNNDCQSNEICKRYLCEGVGDYCGYIQDHVLYDYECCFDEECDSGFECTSNECVLEPGACLSDDDCDDDSRCEEVYAYDHDKCVPFLCESFEIAQDHECILKTGACYHSSDCSGGQICMYDWCVTPGCEVGGSTECCSHDDCSDEEYCSDEECVSVVAASDCGYSENHVWNDYECCSNEDCDSNQHCEIATYECVFQEGYCEGSGDCEEGYVCEENECVLAGVEPVACLDECCSNDDCPDYKFCDNGECELKNGKCDNSNDCDSDESCVSNSCVEKEVVELDCEGDVNLQLTYLESKAKLRATISGIDHCDGKTVTVNLDGCDGEIKCAFESGDEGGYCEFLAPTEAGTYGYAACVDLDGDGDKEFDNEIYSVKEGSGECTSTGCTIPGWSNCVCEEGENIGTQTGTCTDNCGEELQFEQSCECEVDEPTQPTQAQMNAENAIEEAEEAIEEAEDEGKDTSQAEEILENAQEAYEAGQYGDAEELAEEAYAFAKEEEEKQLWENPTVWVICGAAAIVGILLSYLLYNALGKPREPSNEDNIEDSLENKLEKLEKDVEKDKKK